MRLIILCLTVIGHVLAVPNGYYHQQYNYKSSSKSYKNNELQHSTDDQGYYRKQGDLEGREKPIVDANSEHSEYVNPNLRNGQYSGGYGDEMTSYGVMNAQDGYRASQDYGVSQDGYAAANRYAANDLRADNMATSDHIIGSRAYTGYGSNYGSNSYGASSYGSSSYGSGSYGSSTSNIQSILESLRRELERDVQLQIQQNNAYSLAELETDVRRKLNDRLRNELITRYGQQTIRNGMSYTIEDGRMQPTANYNEQEYQRLKTELENALLSKLRTGYNQRVDSHYEESHRYNYGYTSTTVRPTVSYQTIYPSLPYYSTQRTVPYTSTYHPESLSNIVTRVQSNLDTNLNQLLDDVYRQYFSSSQQYQLTNTDVVLRRLQNELRTNISSLIDTEINRNYGTQSLRDGYMYTVGSNGEIANTYNYAARDLEALKTQVETNLIRKLTENFNTYKTRWAQSHSSSSGGSSNVIYGNNYVYSTTPRYHYSTTPYSYSTTPYSYSTTPYSYSTTPYGYYSTPVVTGIKGGSGSNYYYGGSSASSSNLAQLQRQLQSDLSRQLHTAINRDYSLYSNTGGSNSQAYQTSLQHLTDELNRNLTRKFQEYSASGSYAAYGHFDRAEMERLQNQLQTDLMRELQQNLQQQYYSSSSYSSSSSSSSSSNSGHFRPIRGFQNNQLGQYRSGSTLTVGDDCDHDEPEPYRSYRMKRSYGTYGGQARQNPQPQYGRLENFQNGQQEIELGQEIDDSDLTQHIEEFGNLQSVDQHQTNSQRKPTDFGQQIDDSDTQQLEPSGYGSLQVGNLQSVHRPQTNFQRKSIEFEQQIDDSDTQQLEPSEFGSLQAGQQVDDSDRYFNHGNAANQYNNQLNAGQQVDDADLTQQHEELGFGKLNENLAQHSVKPNSYSSNINFQSSRGYNGIPKVRF